MPLPDKGKAGEEKYLGEINEFYLGHAESECLWNSPVQMLGIWVLLNREVRLELKFFIGISYGVDEIPWGEGREGAPGKHHPATYDSPSRT